MTFQLDDNAKKVFAVLSAGTPLSLYEIAYRCTLQTYEIERAMDILVGQRLVVLDGPPKFGRAMRYRAVKGGTDAAKTSGSDC